MTITIQTTTAEQPLLHVDNLTHNYGGQLGCQDIQFSIYPGEILGIVGESGSGKTTVLKCLSGMIAPSQGAIEFLTKSQVTYDLRTLPEVERRKLSRGEWGIVHQHARDGLRMDVSAGGNIAEKLMENQEYVYENLREKAKEWLAAVEIDPRRIDDIPTTFSGGMQQRLQIARVLCTYPRLVFMDEPTGGLDVSVQARLLDLIRKLVAQMGVSAIIVTHDLAVARLLADHLIVMKSGKVVEAGLTDQVLDDPHHPYTQTLVSAVLQV